MHSSIPCRNGIEQLLAQKTEHDSILTRKVVFPALEKDYWKELFWSDSCFLRAISETIEEAGRTITRNIESALTKAFAAANSKGSEACSA